MRKSTFTESQIIAVLKEGEADALDCAHAFRTLNIMDKGNREALNIGVATLISARRVSRIVDELIEPYGNPPGHQARQRLRTDLDRLHQVVPGKTYLVVCFP